MFFTFFQSKEIDNKLVLFAKFFWEQDLIFPHHENELAQARAACMCHHPSGDDVPSAGNKEESQASMVDYSYARYWMHNGFVTLDEEKMSKSLGNFKTIRSILDEVHPLALRYGLISTHYRSPLNYTPDFLESSTDRVYYLFQVNKPYIGDEPNSICYDTYMNMCSIQTSSGREIMKIVRFSMPFSVTRAT